MKKKKVVKILFGLICLIAIVGIALFYCEKKREKKEWIEQELLKIDYREQNDALPRVAGHSPREECYVGYDAIDEAELYVWLAAYNEHLAQCASHEQELTLTDIEEYLSSEYNEDGSLRIQKGYESIRAYVDWYFEEEGDDDIAEYWRELDKIAIEYRGENLEIKVPSVTDMDIAQLQELIRKRNDPSYEINKEVMQE